MPLIDLSFYKEKHLELWTSNLEILMLVLYLEKLPS